MRATDYHDIGRYLRDIRESQRLTVQEAATAMHIRPHYVEALEAGNLAILPGKAYVRGYIRNYALFLGINPHEALEAYDALTATSRQELYIPEPTIHENLPSRGLIMGLMVLAVFLYGYYLFSHRTGEVISPTVADVPAGLMMQVVALKDASMADWMACLESADKACFTELRGKQVVGEVPHPLFSESVIRSQAHQQR